MNGTRTPSSVARLVTLPLLAALAACGGASAGGSPSPDGMLTMRMPSSATAQVVRHDTALVNVDAGMMGQIEMDVQSEGTIDLAFAESAGGVQVTATYSAFQGMMTNPMAGNISVDADDIGGQLVFTMDERGRSTVSESFDVQAEAAQMVGSKALAFDLFPRFPQGVPTPGMSWVDTVDVEEEGDFTATQRMIVTWTMAGDTVVDGRTLVRLDHESQVEMSTIGEQQGMSMSQDMSGTASGWTLWDPNASMTFAAYTETDLGGVVSVDVAGAGDMAIQLSSRSHTRGVY